MGVPGKGCNGWKFTLHLRVVEIQRHGERQIGWQAAKEIARGRPILKEIAPGLPSHPYATKKGRPLDNQSASCDRRPDPLPPSGPNIQRIPENWSFSPAGTGVFINPHANGTPLQ